MTNKLLSEALADAKAVQSTAYANAKMMLEETFQPKIQRLVSQKLAEEEELEDEPEMDEEPSGLEGFDFGDEEEMEAEPEMEESEDFEMEEGDEFNDDELSELLREFDDEGEEEMVESDEFEMEEGEDFELEESDDFELEESDDEEDAMYEQILRELEGEDDELTESEDGGGSYEETAPTRHVNSENKKLRSENKKLRRERNEALSVVTKLKSTINEVNLLNAKLMYLSKVNKDFTLNQARQNRILEMLDRAKNVRETKLIYATICESLRRDSLKKVKTHKVGGASKTMKTPTKKTMTESFNAVPRWQVLAGIKSIED